MENKKIAGYKWFVVKTRDGYERKVCEGIMHLAKNFNMRDEINDVCVVYETKPKKKVRSTERKKKAYVSEFEINAEPIVDAYINFTEKELQQMQEEEERRYEYEDAIEISLKGYVYVKMACFEPKPELAIHSDVVSTVMSNEAWQEIRRIAGVTGILSEMNVPISVRPAEVKKLHLDDPDARREPGVVVLEKTSDESKKVSDVKEPSEGKKVSEPKEPKRAAVKVLYSVGDTVIVKEGSFINNVGEVASIDLNNSTVSVSIAFLGRKQLVEMPLDAVEKI